MKTAREVYLDIEKIRKSDNQVYALRLLCETYNEQELHEAKNHFNCTSNDPLGMVVQEAISRLRHVQLTKRLEALEKPHWTLVPTFWAVIGTVVIGIIGLIVACFAWLDPLQQLEDKPSNSISMPPQKPLPGQQTTAPKPTPPASNAIALPSFPKQ